MPSIGLYLLKSVLFTAIPIGYYYLFLRHKKLYYFNRAYLLMIVPLSLVLPIVNLNFMPVQYSRAMNFKIFNAIASAGYEPESFSPSQQFHYESLIPYIYFLPVIFLLILFIRKLSWINRIKHSYPSTTKDNVTLIETDLPHAPFSFLSTIYWRNDISMNTALGTHVMQHEMTHVKLKHSLDKLFLQIIIIFFWINPFYWLIDRELSLQHEFAADASATNGDSRLLSLILLQTQFSTVFPQIVHPFFSSSIKQRLSMINLPGKTKFAFLRKMLIAPILLGAVILFSYQNNPHRGSIVRSEKNIKLILDAGHGGTDNGAMENDAIKEKDLALLITKQITALAPEFNISVFPIRSDDQTIDVRQRLEKSETAGGDLYVSIHMDVKGKSAGPAAGYSMVICNENHQPDQSKALASAMIARLANGGLPFTLLEQNKVYVLRENKLPAILLECGNINNPEDVKRIHNKASLESLSRNILNGIVDYSNKK